jgi:hypothetical protein
MREYGNYADVNRLAKLGLDPTAFPDALTLQSGYKMED